MRSIRGCWLTLIALLHFVCAARPALAATSADAVLDLVAYPARFRIVFDPDGLLPEKFGVRGMPTSFLIDREGRVQLRHEGFFVRERDELTRQVQTLLLAH
jgi:hypothetical protein